MAGLQKKSMNSPDDIKELEKTKVQSIKAGNLTLERMIAEPGWQWSKHVKPIVKTESCEKNHTFYVISGNMHLRMDDGTEMDFGEGDVGLIPPGHDAWVVGDKPVIGIDIISAAQ